MKNIHSQSTLTFLFTITDYAKPTWRFCCGLIAHAPDACITPVTKSYADITTYLMDVELNRNFQVEIDCRPKIQNSLVTNDIFIAWTF